MDEMDIFLFVYYHMTKSWMSGKCYEDVTVDQLRRIACRHGIAQTTCGKARDKRSLYTAILSAKKYRKSTCKTSRKTCRTSRKTCRTSRKTCRKARKTCRTSRKARVSKWVPQGIRRPSFDIPSYYDPIVPYNTGESSLIQHPHQNMAPTVDAGLGPGYGLNNYNPTLNTDGYFGGLGQW